MPADRSILRFTLSGNSSSLWPSRCCYGTGVTCAEFSITMSSSLKTLMVFVPTSSHAFTVVGCKDTDSHKEGVRVGSLSSQDASWSPCKFAHSDHLCILSFDRQPFSGQKRSSYPFPQSSRCLFIVYFITNKGHSWIFPEQKAGTF